MERRLFITKQIDLSYIWQPTFATKTESLLKNLDYFTQLRYIATSESNKKKKNWEKEDVKQNQFMQVDSLYLFRIEIFFFMNSITLET